MCRNKENNQKEIIAMNNKTKKMKIAMVTNHFGITGISMVIMNYCKALDRNKFNLTIIAGSPVNGQYKRDCKLYGINMVELPSRHQKPIEHYFQLWKNMEKSKYDIVHIHGNSSLMSVELLIAKIAGIKVRIAHSHNSACPNMRLHKLLSPYFRRLCTKSLACSSLAGEWLFGNGNFQILPNGFCVKKFLFEESQRKRLRNKMKLENKFIVGHIGRINEQKNHQYLLKIFQEIAEKKENAFLLLVGDGPDYEKIKKVINNHSYKERIILYGETDNTAAMYSAMDVFVFPSKYEGLPVVLLEAQISGLPCIVSDRVTREVDFGDLCWKSITDEPEAWAEASIEKNMDLSERQNYFDKHKSQVEKYDICRTVRQLEAIYLEGQDL